MQHNLEEIGLFWTSLEALDAMGDEERMAKAVSMLVEWVLTDPRRAMPNDQGIRVLKLPSTEIDGGMTVPLRLAYYIEEEPRPGAPGGTVVLLHVEPYDEVQELFDGGAAPPRSH